MALKTLSAKAATALDQELMSTCAFSLDQLMELAGLSVSQAGGDGLVAARHLRHYGYQPSVYYPKRGKNELYQRLTKQLEDLEVPFVDDFKAALSASDHVVDAIFGFSFSGEVREPFPAIIRALAETKVPVTSVDAPSSWDIENGPPEPGQVGSNFNPAVLVSLTAPKPLAKHFKGRHFVGGRGLVFAQSIALVDSGERHDMILTNCRFVTPAIATKYDLDLPEYDGIDQIAEVAADSASTEKL
ncbi:uncharacterized protein PpBr36_09847 [Pyricularia pennisetigena]|uniref:uncharacterized protein n=1 Tax=Pyricularia pennisetigena TaxID=1578925 RepID=UPI00114D5AE7|nr:uncharacterized protein PpBr36_09847 [Pyricularia pennisetigena]TLS22261.1 hypothetical protein PpBr36_09847 [Pyricularia pennisetigena]